MWHTLRKISNLQANGLKKDIQIFKTADVGDPDLPKIIKQCIVHLSKILFVPVKCELIFVATIIEMKILFPFGLDL